MKKKVYVETSIASYLTGKPSRNLLAAALQSLTIEWWENRRHQFDLFISELIIEEAGRGNPDASKRRLEAINGIPLLVITDPVVELSKKLIEQGALPENATDDALHIAISSVHGVDYLLTWNFRHIDNAETKPIIRSVCISNGFLYPEICTPQELLGGN